MLKMRQQEYKRSCLVRSRCGQNSLRRLVSRTGSPSTLNSTEPASRGISRVELNGLFAIVRLADWDGFMIGLDDSMPEMGTALCNGPALPTGFSQRACRHSEL